MCGRTACTLAPDDVCRACGYKTSDGKWRQPRWQDPPGGQKYYSSYNVAPGSHTPVLLAKSHFDGARKRTKETETENTETTFMTSEEESLQEAEVECQWVVQVMRWGLVPFWHSGDTKSIGSTMVNARSDGILSKRCFKGPLEKGRRCVVLIDGYYEWQQTSDGKKQPHFIFFPHATSETVTNLNKQTTEAQADQAVFTGRRLLTLAGLFDIWKSGDGEAPLYSYCIITVDSHKSMSQLHDRMPAVLDGEEDVNAWLDYGSVPMSKAVELIQPRSSLTYHPVSTCVNSVKNKSDECVKPVDLEKEKQQRSGSSNFMKAWLSKGKKRSVDEDDEPEPKPEADKPVSDSDEQSSKKKQKPEADKE